MRSSQVWPCRLLSLDAAGQVGDTVQQGGNVDLAPRHVRQRLAEQGLGVAFIVLGVELPQFGFDFGDAGPKPCGVLLVQG
jgi:hypothetical protein